MDANSRLTNTERAHERSQYEIRTLKLSESRLQQECEMLRREKSGSQLLIQKMNSMQSMIERGDDEARQRLQNEKDRLQNDCLVLRQKVDDEVNNYRSSLESWQATEKMLQKENQKMQLQDLQAQRSLEKSLSDLRAAKEEVQITEHRLAEIEVMLGNSAALTSKRSAGEMITSLKNSIMDFKNEQETL